MSKITKFWSLKRKQFFRGLNYLWIPILECRYCMQAEMSSVRSQIQIYRCVVDPQDHRARRAHNSQRLQKPLVRWRYRGLNKDIKSVGWRKPTGRQLFAILCHAAPVPVFYLWDLGPTAQLKRATAATPGSSLIRRQLVIINIICLL